LIEWLAKNRVPDIPVRSLVVMSNPKTIINAAPSNKEVPQYITHNPYHRNALMSLIKCIQLRSLRKKI
jgi:hypothetical protein